MLNDDLFEMCDALWKRNSPDAGSPAAANERAAGEESGSEKKENTTLYGDDELELVERTVLFRTEDDILYYASHLHGIKYDDFYCNLSSAMKR